MKKYKVYKDSGVEWIGEIPGHWEVKKIKFLSPVKRGASPRPISDPKYFDESGEYSWVRIADVSASERYLKKTKQTLSKLGASLSVKREANDFFLSIAGTVGKPIITKIKCCIHDGFVWFPELKINPEFLYYNFTTGLPYKGLGKLGTQLNLNTETVGNILIPFPTTDREIEKIVSYLDHKTQQIDQLITLKEQKIALLQEKRTALINQAVTKGLDPTVPMKDSGVEWIGEIPGHWDKRKLAWSFDMIGSGTTPKSGLAAFYDNGTINWLLTGDLNDGYIRETSKKITEHAKEKHSALKEYPIGSVVIAMYGATIGKLGILEIETTTNQACCVLANSSFYIEKYVFYWLLASREEIINLSYGGGQPNISQDIIRNLWLSCPPMKEQQKIVTYLNHKTQQIDHSITQEQQKIKLLKEYRQTLISNVVTGKIRVCDQDLSTSSKPPTYEEAHRN